MFANSEAIYYSVTISENTISNQAAYCSPVHSIRLYFIISVENQLEMKLHDDPIYLYVLMYTYT